MLTHETKLYFLVWISCDSLCCSVNAIGPVGGCRSIPEKYRKQQWQYRKTDRWEINISVFYRIHRMHLRDDAHRNAVPRSRYFNHIAFTHRHNTLNFLRITFSQISSSPMYSRVNGSAATAVLTEIHVPQRSPSQQQFQQQSRNLLAPISHSSQSNFELAKSIGRTGNVFGRTNHVSVNAKWNVLCAQFGGAMGRLFCIKCVCPMQCFPFYMLSLLR